ncbi:MAG: GNAT family N-acetyltransferase [Acetobacter persici]|uniref:GNAT family N-acetyltransferase n=1 Tax=Acetobacter persici TaxID=1076596 RepID=UPI0039E8B194
MKSSLPLPVKHSPDISVRLARYEDVVLLPEIERSAAQSFTSIPSLAWIADGPCLPVETHMASLEAGTCWVAVTQQGRPVGFLTAERARDRLHILEISVEAEAQARGVGRALLAAARQAAQQGGFQRITLTTCREVPWNAPFYQKIGFEILEERVLEPDLRAALAEEEECGFPPGTRCAMQLRLQE